MAVDVMRKLEPVSRRVTVHPLAVRGGQQTTAVTYAHEGAHRPAAPLPGHLRKTVVRVLRLRVIVVGVTAPVVHRAACVSGDASVRRDARHAAHRINALVAVKNEYTALVRPGKVLAAAVVRRRALRAVIIDERS